MSRFPGDVWVWPWSVVRLIFSVYTLIGWMPCNVVNLMFSFLFVFLASGGGDGI